MPHSSSPDPWRPSPSATAFRFADGRASGIPRRALDPPRFDRPFHGVRAHGFDLDALVDRCRAFLPVLGPDSCFSHVTAALLHGMPQPLSFARDDRLHVVTVGRDAHTRRPEIRGWRTASVIPAIWRDGLPVADPVTVWCQLATLPRSAGLGQVSVEWLVAIGDWLISGQRAPGGTRTAALATMEDLRAAVRRHGRRRGAALLGLALPRIRGPVDSPPETFLRLGLVDHGLPEPLTQVSIRTRGGWQQADLGYPEERVLLEYQGDHHRTDREQWRRDLTRVQWYEDAGYRVFLVSAADISPSCTELASRVRRALSTGDR